MREWIQRFTQSMLPAIVGDRSVDTLDLELPSQEDEQAVAQWLTELIRKLGALYAVSDSNELRFLRAHGTMLRAVSHLESRVAALERRWRSLLADRSLPQGTLAVDLFARVVGTQGVSYLSEAGGYTLGAALRTDRLLSPDGMPLARCRLVRSLGTLRRDAQAERLVGGHPEDPQEWVTESEAPFFAGDWTGSHTWIPANYTYGDLLQFELELLEPIYANELVLVCSHPLSVLQYRYHPTGLKGQLNSAPVYDASSWGNMNVQQVIVEGRRCARLNSDVGSVVWHSTPLPDRIAGESSRSIIVRLQLYPHQRCQLRLEANWIRNGRSVGFSAHTFDLRDRQVWQQVEVELDEPGLCELVTIQLRLFGADEGTLLDLHRMDVFVSLLHQEVSSTPRASHVIPLRVHAPFTRFCWTVNQPIYSLTESGVQYRFGLAAIRLRSSPAPEQGLLEFEPLESPDTVRYLTVNIQGEGLQRSELLVEVPGEGTTLRIPLEAHGGSARVAFLEQGERPPRDGDAYIYRVGTKSAEDTFDGTEAGNIVTLSHCPWIDRGRVQACYRALGYYDPNAPVLDPEWVAAQVAAGRTERLNWLLSQPNQWSAIGATLTHEGEWVSCSNVTDTIQLQWDPPTISLPEDLMFAMVVAVSGIDPERGLTVKVDGSPIRPLWVSLPAKSPYPNMNWYLLVFDLSRLARLQMECTSNAAYSLRVWRRYGYVPRVDTMVPIELYVQYQGNQLLPAVSGETRDPKGPTTVQAERLQRASSTRMAEYQLWQQQNQLSYAFSADWPVYMTRLWPILVENQKVHLELSEVLPDGTSSPVPLSECRLVPEYGLISLTRPLKQDAYLVASYTSTAADPERRSYPPVTMNRTDYVGGRQPALRRPDWNPMSSGYYPVLEYHQRGRQLKMSIPIPRYGDAPSSIRVRYRYLPVRARLRLVLRRDGLVLPIVHRAVATVVTESEGLQAVREV